jgi:hypothetical protein
VVILLRTAFSWRRKVLGRCPNRPPILFIEERLKHAPSHLGL